MLMELRIDRQALVPVVQQIVDAVAGWIRREEVSPGTRLPSTRALARDNLVSQSSVIEAYERLITQGVLASRHGSGFVVAAPLPVSTCACDAAWFEGSEPQRIDRVDAGPAALKLCCGSLPESWRETDDLSYAIRQVTRTDMAGLFSYSTPLGLPALRQQILKRLKLLDIPASEDSLLSTAGASQALDLVVRTLLKPGDCVVVENPGYAPLFDLLRLHGVRMVEVPRTPRGPDIDILEAVLASNRPQALFINSFFHNPTGSNLAPAVANRVLALAKHYGVLVIEDDVYADLNSPCGARLASRAGDTSVIYVGSFSKTLSSSLRVGFVVAPSEMVARLAEVKMVSSMGASRFCEAVLANLLANGAYRKLVQRQRQRLSCHRAQVLQALDDAEWEVFGKPSGGLFVWARAKWLNHEQLRELASDCGVQLSSPGAFSPTGEAGNWLRINVAFGSDPRAMTFFKAATRDRPRMF